LNYYTHPGSYWIIRTDGSETLYEERPTLWQIRHAIGCTSLDTVVIDHKNQIIMFVDDTGMIDGRPVNPKATQLYHSVCKPGTVWSIHGDVAIVNDKDFA
jgi:hypothetical protein